MRHTTRRVPGTRWVTVFAAGTAQRGHAWMYGGLVRRDCWRLPEYLPGRIGGFAVGIMVMDRVHPTWFTGSRRAAFEEHFGPSAAGERRRGRRTPASHEQPDDTQAPAHEPRAGA